MPFRHLILFLYYVAISFATCRAPINLSETKSSTDYYLPKVHQEPQLYIADSLLLLGRLKQAGTILVNVYPESKHKTFIRARLAEIDYYRNVIYGHENFCFLDRIDSDLTDTGDLDYFNWIYRFYADDHFDVDCFKQAWSSFSSKHDESHYFVNKGYALLGEYYKVYRFDLDSTETYFSKYLECEVDKDMHKNYESFWVHNRMTDIGTYRRDHLSSLYHANVCLDTTEFDAFIDSIHLAFAHAARAYILFRFDKFTEAEKDNRYAFTLLRDDKPTPVYQFIHKSMMMTAIHAKDDSLFWESYRIVKSIALNSKDCININRLIGLYYFNKKEYEKSVNYNLKAYNYESINSNEDIPVIQSINYLLAEAYIYQGKFNDAQHWIVNQIINSNTKKGNMRQSDYSFFLPHQIGLFYYSLWLDKKEFELFVKSEEYLLKADSLYLEFYTKNTEINININSERYLLLNILSKLYLDQFDILKDRIYISKYINIINNKRYYLNNFPNRDYSLYGKAIKGLTVRSNCGSNPHVYCSENTNYIKSILPIRIKKYSLDDLQNLSRMNNSAIIIFDNIEDNLFIISIDSRDFYVRKVPELARIEDSLRKYRESLEESFIEGFHESELILNKMYMLLFGVDYIFSRNKSIQIVLDHPFNDFNFETLISEKRIMGKNKLNFILYEKDIKYALSFNNLHHAPISINNIAIGALAWSSSATILNSELDCLYTELPGSLMEVEYLKHLFPNSEVAYGYDATEKKLISLYASMKINFMHISTHSEYLPNEDIFPYFILRENRSFIKFDVLKLLNLRTNIKTFVLSTCHGLSGRHVHGDGIHNLTYFLFRAGAERVIASVGLLNDNTAPIIIKKMYTLLKSNIDLQKALKQAKIEYIKTSGNEHPFYWSSMMYFGN